MHDSVILGLMNPRLRFITALILMFLQRFITVPFLLIPIRHSFAGKEVFLQCVAVETFRKYPELVDGTVVVVDLHEVQCNVVFQLTIIRVSMVN